MKSPGVAAAHACRGAAEELRPEGEDGPHPGELAPLHERDRDERRRGCRLSIEQIRSVEIDVAIFRSAKGTAVHAEFEYIPADNSTKLPQRSE